MTDELIKQNAEVYANTIRIGGLGYSPELIAMVSFEDGAHSRDEEIKELQTELESLRKGFYERGDKLKELMLANNKLRNPWISVEDKLPQLNKICFGMRDGKIPRICMLVKKKNGECVFNTPNEEYEYPKGKITHWMPIPELNKGE
jgi:hypothetical protein